MIDPVNATLPNPPLGEADLSMQYPQSSSIPEDDGMQQLRQKMHKIRQLAENTDDMAKRMHQLMSHHYYNTTRQTALSRSPSSSLITRPPVLSPAVKPSPQDLAPTFCPITPHDPDDPHPHQEPVYGCQHYQRNVKIQCSDCQRWYTCRHCHDQSPDLPYPHKLERRAIRNMLCMPCRHVQPAGPLCTHCGHDSAYYYCSKCKLWDNDSTKRIYHCDDCGICRRGEGLGRDYVHCKRCNVCISISTSTTHPCIERATEGDCPLCLDYLFTSSTPVVSLLCGHYMHGTCYKDLMNVTYRCPICSKSAVNMELQWRKLDDEIMLQPMPDTEYEGTEPLQPDDSIQGNDLGSVTILDTPPQRNRLPRRVWIGCNDCGGRGWTNFHWLGLKCPVCDGYNTNQMTPTGRAPSMRSRVDTHCQRHHDLTGAHAIRSFGGDLAEHGMSHDEFPARSVDGTSFAQTAANNSDDLAGPRATIRSYFLRPEAADVQARPASVTSGSFDSHFVATSLPYDLLQRVSRSLSPMRSYIEGFAPPERAMSATRILSQYAASLTRKQSDIVRNSASGTIDDDDDEHGTDQSDDISSSDEVGWNDPDEPDLDLDDMDHADEDDIELFGHR